MDSRLDRMIARLTTQRRALERAAEETRDLPGPVLEIGLGKGRTYSHLRKLFPDRRIIAFDRDLHAPADAAPAGADLVLGDFRETLSALSGCAPAALAHADFGSEDRDTARPAGWRRSSMR
ncbi:class I SAM-dependent methyltransferase [Mesorhizobium sp.]|uniref:class I SAM-dependent methyltransferase n=1 Tax=Mesorhizobium sp. TaxID=1871066 RepID=UPI0025C3EA37|nr:class I SAM-dependent methyltransferase [Mesorhizobium sp.]